MKLTIYGSEPLEELFTSSSNLQAHYDKHVVKNHEFAYSIEEYEDRANKLMRTPVDNKNIFGYISETREGKVAYCKYDKDTEEFVVYAYDGVTPLTITMYRKPWRDFTGDKAIEYFGEIASNR